MALAPVTVGRQEVLRFRFRRHDLHRQAGTAGPTDVALLDYGVRDTGPDGAAWAMAVRGAPPVETDDLGLAWTLRGAPHAYRRSDLAAVAVATAPLSEADAAKRIFDAATSLRSGGIGALDAMRTVAGHLRDIVTEPTVKGEASTRLTELLDDPYLRFCRSCNATHTYEQLFRLPPLHAGLELEAGTSPPVLRRVPGLRPPLYRQLAGAAEPRFDAVRNYLRFYGPARARDAAAFLDAPVKDVKAHWPEDAVEVGFEDEPSTGRRDPRFVLADDLETLTGPGSDDPARAVRLVGPYDPYLQLRDRELLVADEAQRKDLWRVLGRPGAILADGEVIGTWRPRASGRKLTVHVEPWELFQPSDRALVEEQAERLSAHRGVVLAGLDGGS
jgi:hypothetical protein